SLLLQERERPEATADALACLREIAAREGPREPHFARLLGCLPVMAWALCEQGKPEEAKKMLAETERMLRRARRDSPDDEALGAVLGPTLLRKGMVLRSLGELDAAGAELERARGPLESRRKRFPGDARAAAHLAALHQELAFIRSASVGYGDAVRELST